MILKDLLCKYTDQEIVGQIIRLYPDEQADGYFHALDQLRAIDPIAPKDGMRIVLEPGHEPEGEYYTGVTGKNGEQEYGHETRWAIGFLDWALWLGMEIDRFVQYEYSEIDTLAHILWELTWHGYERGDSQKRLSEIGASYDDYKQHPEDAMTMEQLLDEMEKGE